MVRVSLGLSDDLLSRPSIPWKTCITLFCAFYGCKVPCVGLMPETQCRHKSEERRFLLRPSTLIPWGACSVHCSRSLSVSANVLSLVIWTLLKIWSKWPLPVVWTFLKILSRWPLTAVKNCNKIYIKKKKIFGYGNWRWIWNGCVKSTCCQCKSNFVFQIVWFVMFAWKSDA